jgi:hypothetical protein
MSTTDRDILQDRVIEAHDRLRHLRSSIEAKKAPYFGRCSGGRRAA